MMRIGKELAQHLSTACQSCLMGDQDLSQNRPGAKGFRSPAPKKKKNGDENDNVKGDKKSAGSPKKKRSRAKLEEEEEEEEDDIVPDSIKKAKSSTKKRKKVEEDDADGPADQAVESPTKIKSKGRPKKVSGDGRSEQADPEDVEKAEQPIKPPKKVRASKKTKILDDEDINATETMPGNDAPEAAKPKGRKKATVSPKKDRKPTADVSSTSH